MSTIAPDQLTKHQTETAMLWILNTWKGKRRDDFLEQAIGCEPGTIETGITDFSFRGSHYVYTRFPKGGFKAVHWSVKP